MKPPKRYISLSPAEYRLLMYTLVCFRNKLLVQGRYADTVDEVILKYFS